MIDRGMSSSLCSNKEKKAKKAKITWCMLVIILRPLRPEEKLPRASRIIFDQRRAPSRTVANSTIPTHKTPLIHTSEPQQPRQVKSNAQATDITLSLSLHHCPFNGKSLELAPTCMVNFPLVGITQFPLPVLQ